MDRGEFSAVRAFEDALPAGIALRSSTDEDVLQTLLAAVTIAVELRRHSVAARPQFAVRCGRVSAALDRALEEAFGDVLTW